MKILITGSAGLVGSEAVSFFKEKGWEVFGIDNNMRSHLFGTTKQFTEHSIDIRDQFAMETVFKNHTFDAIIHAAAQPSHDWAKNDPLMDFDINARATLILLELTRRYCPEAAFVHVSTDKVYGENMRIPNSKNYEQKTRWNYNHPFTEGLGLDFAGERSLFGCSKAAADMYAQEYANYFGMKVGIFRPGCITGRNHQGAEFHGFLAYLVKCIKEGGTYHVFGFEGKQVRDQIHAYDLVHAFFHFIQNPKKGAVYNIGGGPERSISVIEAVIQVGARLGKEPNKDYKLSFEGARKGDRKWDVHDVSKFRKDYPEWDYRYSLKDIIDDLCS